LCPPRKANGSTAHFFLPQSAKPIGAIGPPGAHFFLPQSTIGPSRKAAYA
jgi:hypothetical protein